MYKKDQILIGIIKSINSKNIILDFEEKYRGIVYINEISDYFVKNINNFFKIGSKIFVIIYKIDEKEKLLYCSYKKLIPTLLKDPFDYIIKETYSGFKNLAKKTEEELKKWEKLI